MEIFLDRLFSGLTSGSIYVLIALALVVANTHCSPASSRGG
jgi:branched-subunit amino acid ABC-type transport system permease component